MEERLLQAEKLCSDAGLFAGSLSQAQTEPLQEQENLKAVLWPFQEAVCLHAAIPLQLKLFQEQSLSSCVSETSALIQAMKMTPSIPPALIGFFEAFQTEGRSQEFSQGISWLFQFSDRSLAVTNSPCNEDGSGMKEAMVILYFKFEYPRHQDALFIHFNI